MSTIEITSKIEALKDLEQLIEEAKAEAESLRDEIKAEMLHRNTEELEAGQYVVRYTTVLSNRFDTTSFKKLHGAKHTPSRPLPSVSLSAHKESPLCEHRPK